MIISKIKNYKNNKLLFWGLACIITSFITAFIINNLSSAKIENNMLYRLNDLTIFQLVLALTLFPMLEEIVFRGIITNKRLLKFVFYLGCFFYIIILKNFYLLPILLLCAYFNEYSKNETIFYFINALLFSLMHHSLDELNHLNTFYSLVGKFGGGIILIWIVINFGLIYSFLLHSFINFFALAWIILSYELTEYKKVFAETNDYSIKIEKVSFFDKNSTIETDMKSKLTATNATVLEVSETFCSHNNSINYFGRYNIEVFSKNPITNKLDCSKINELIVKEIGGMEKK